MTRALATLMELAHLAAASAALHRAEGHRGPWRDCPELGCAGDVRAVVAGLHELEADELEARAKDGAA